MSPYPSSESTTATFLRVRLGLRLAPVAFLAVVLFATAEGPPLSASPAPAAGPAQLIYAGWFGNTIPTPSFISTNLAFLETQPFDGLVVYLRDAALTVNATTRVMTNTPVSYESAALVLAPLAGLPFTRLTHNLGLIQGSTPPDFFDDWTVPIQNFANVARAARGTGLKGLCFDNEQYFAPWGSYAEAKYRATKSLAQYQAQARLRGRQVLEAMAAQFPDIVVLTLHGPYISEPDAPASLDFPQWQNGNELLGPFFAGFTEGVGTSAAANMDGGELYTLRSADQFQASYSWRKWDLASAAVDCAFIPEALRSAWPDRSSISFGVYDRSFGGASMDPAILRTTLANALRQADRYVWFYAEAATYLLPPTLGGASDTWVNAIAQARVDAAAASSLVPAAPANLRAVPAATSSVDLAWEDQSTNENGFSVERLISGSWTQISWVPDNVTTYVDATVSPNTEYRYRVLAFNAAGNSSPSNEVSATTVQPSVVPAAPSNLRVVSVTASSVELAWEDGSTNENGFSVERLMGGSWTQIGWVPDNVTTYVDATVSPNTEYRYRVLAFNAAGNSPPSNEVSATTAQTLVVPAAPSNLRATSVTATSVTLEWVDQSGNENGFSVEQLKGGSWTQIGWVPDNVTIYRDTNVRWNTRYRYRVLAFNAAGNSSSSNEVRVRTPRR
ncbi:MAG: fibronectin type III domain-containing protein [Planctomycetes bacterium]|nr:fibronectin type III domain-containing protein [Planctomycetota bacterium]